MISHAREPNPDLAVEQLEEKSVNSGQNRAN